MSDLPTVTAVIPVRNEEKHIRTVIEHCLAQEYPPDKLEFVIADGMSEDGTRREIATALEEQAGESSPAVRVIDNPEHIVPTGFNRALRESKSDVILIMGAHAEYAPDYIAQCVRVLDDTGADNVGGPAIAVAGGYAARAIAAAYNSPFSVGGARFHNTAYEGYADTVTFGCWRREYLLSLGGYDEEFVRNQDDELNLRITLSGGKIYQSPSIKSYYYPRDSFLKLFRQQFQYGYWKVRVIQKNKRPASIRHLVPTLFVCSLVAGAVLSFLYLWFAYAYTAALALYVLSSGIFSVKAALRNGLGLLPAIPAVFLIYHVGYGLGFIVGFIDFVLTRKTFSRLFGDSAQTLTR